MKSLLPSLRDVNYQSVAWRASKVVAGVDFSVRRPSLGQRIELTKRIREITLRNEFLRAGEPADQVEAALAELLVKRLYIEWGLAEIRGLKIDGKPATVETVLESGPEGLAEELLAAVLSEAELTEDERKNS